MPVDSEVLLQAILDLQTRDIPDKDEALEKLIEELDKHNDNTKPINSAKSISKLVSKEYQPILAIDMDGTLVDTPKHGNGPPPSLQGLPPVEVEIDGNKIPMPEVIRAAAKQGYRIVIFTGRDDEKEIEEWLEANNVPYESINQREDQPTESPKVIASGYVDDRAMSPNDLARLIMGNRSLGKSLVSRIRRKK